MAENIEVFSGMEKRAMEKLDEIRGLLDSGIIEEEKRACELYDDRIKTIKDRQLSFESAPQAAA